MSSPQSNIPLTAEVRKKWDDWLLVTRDRCHLHFEFVGATLEDHLAACLNSADYSAERIADDIGFVPKRILEVGCSTGFNCIALATRFPQAEVVGIEPDEEAVQIARSMVAAAGMNKVEFQVGYGECLSFPDEQFDFIVCHTVIEHVKNVEQVVSEMARVLAPGGSLHLEAPNYVWPYEPHLGIWCIPLLGKGMARFMARVQLKSEHVGYLGHLQFVTPGRLERAFRAHGLTWQNRARQKIERILGGDASQVKAYQRMASLLHILAQLGLRQALVRFILFSGLYPSVLYTARKAPVA